MDTNRTTPSLPFGQGELQGSVPRSFCQPTLHGMDKFFGFEMPRARSPQGKPNPFVYAPGEGPFNIMCPDPRPSKWVLDRKTLACLNRMDDRDHFEREANSPFDTGQNSPVNNVAKFEDAPFTHTPTSATFGAFTPYSWSSSSPSLFSSSASSCSSFSCPQSTVPYSWSPNMNPSNETDWPNDMPRFVYNGDQQYHNPNTAHMQFGWEVPSANEEIVRELNHEPRVNDTQTDGLSSSYAIAPYGSVGLEPFPALQRPPAVPFAYQGTTTSTTLSPQNEAASRPIVSQPTPHYQSLSHSIYLSKPGSPNNMPSATDTSTAPVIMTHPDNIHYQRQQQAQSMANTDSSMARAPESASEAFASAPVSSAPTPTSASQSSRNSFLMDCKRRGLSYKEIKRLGNFKEAESTLRGRYRTLTKSKDQRVRKPQWEEPDIRLLCDAVNLYSAETETNPNRRANANVSSGNSQDPPAAAVASAVSAGSPPKVSWKKVAQYIWTHGGSYHFGNATCKKKWREINGIDGGV